MANVKISELTEASLPLDGTEDMVIVKDGATVRVSTQDVADLGVVTVKVSVSSAEILAGNTTPKTLIAAPGAGKVICPLQITTRMRYATAAYAANTTIQVRYAGISSTVLMTNALIGVAEDVICRQNITSTVSLLEATDSPINKAVQFFVPTGNPTTGGGSLDIYITYVVITL